MWASLASQYRLAGQPQQAVKVLEKSVALSRKALAADPENASAQRDLVVALANMMLALNGEGSWARAREVETELLPLQRTLRAADPDNLQTVTDLPRITFQQVGGQAVNFLDSAVPSKKNARFQVNCWAVSRDDAAKISALSISCGWLSVQSSTCMPPSEPPTTAAQWSMPR